MRTHLRLHKEHSVERDADESGTLRFPEAIAAARRSLVAGVVQIPATPEAPIRSALRTRSGVLARIEKGRVRPTATEDMMSQVERTLDEMQAKIDRLKDDAENAYKFPPPSDDGRPWAA